MKWLDTLAIFFPSNADNYFRGESIQPQNIPQDAIDQIDLEVQEKGSLRYIISTKVGSGPEVLEATESHLLNSDGLPTGVISC